VVLLYVDVNGVNLLLHGRGGLLHGCHQELHGAHAPLNSGQCLHDLRIADFRLGWRIISPQLSI